MARKSKREIPSNKEVAKDVGKLKKKVQSNLLFHKRLTVITFVFFLLSFSVLILFSESVLENPSTPIQGYFIIDSCQIPSLSKCEFEIHGNNAILRYKSRYQLHSIEFPKCESYKVYKNGTAELFNCDFSIVSNQVDVIIRYINPNSGLIHNEKARIIQLFEITSLRQTTLEFIDDIT